jgi:hypothetical protein
MINAKTPNKIVSLSISLKGENRSMFTNDNKEVMGNYSSVNIKKYNPRSMWIPKLQI